jgi:hypothetical protein
MIGRMESMSEERKSFWATLPGILTGMAAVITAITGLYIAYGPDTKESVSPGSQPTSLPAPATKAIEPTEWPLIADVSFTEIPSGWIVGNNASPETPRFEIRVVGGKYRWDIEFQKNWDRWVESPYGSALNFFLAADVRVAESKSVVKVALTFGHAGNKHYAFKIGADKYFGLSRSEGDVQPMILDWTPTQIELNEVNRMAVLVHNQEIKIYLNSKVIGEYRDPSFTGGKVGLSVEGEQGASAVVDFDNFEFRRMTQ